MQTRIKTAQEIVAMRESGRMLATVLKQLGDFIGPGMSTKDIAEQAKEELRKLGGQPTFLGYQGFPDVICVSVNDEIVHGIPRQDHEIKSGDIVGIDFGVTYRGMITDSAVTIIVGQVPQAVNKLVKTTSEALDAGIDQIKDGVRVGDISSAIQKVLDRESLGIIRELVGHGVGHELHEEPNIPNYGHRGSGPILRSGTTIAIEPMATLGGHGIKTDKDNWTIRTVDGSLAAHFEHTVLVTDEGFEVLTSL